MKKILIIPLCYLLLFIISMIAICPIYSQPTKNQVAIDAKVEKFLESNRYNWRDMNISSYDGQVLHDIIIKNGYTKALEIGTSTGHSGIWIAWALSKTGGKLITIEIDEGRHKEALANFKEAGLSDYIDARLGDAHRLVPSLEGPFDFVFSDADKYWYTNYVKAVLPKLEKGGCFTAHNVSDLRRGGGIGEFVDFIENEPSLETTYERSSRAGISVSYKIR